MDELSNFVKLKDFSSIKQTEFALYIYTNELIKVIEFQKAKTFINELNESRNKIKNLRFKAILPLDMSGLFQEA